MSLTRNLYRLARISNNVNAFTSPKRAPRRAKNIVVGKALARAGFWRSLWR